MSASWSHPVFPGCSLSTGAASTLGEWANVSDALFFQWMFQCRHQWNKSCTATLTRDLHEHAFTPRVCSVLASCLRINLVVFGNEFVDAKLGHVFRGRQSFQLFAADPIYNMYRPHVCWVVAHGSRQSVRLHDDEVFGSQHVFVQQLAHWICSHAAAREGHVRQMLQSAPDQVMLEDLQEHCLIKRVPIYKPGSRSSKPFVSKTKAELIQSLLGSIDVPQSV
jgi:hypothetical protein